MKKYLPACLFFILMWSGAPYAADSQIIIKDHAFTPSTVTVSVGTKVTWINHDEDPHTIADMGSQHQFRSQALDTNDSYSYTFTTPGTYSYFCTLHPVMTGKIIVTSGTPN